ncbi:MAG: hypothetical protein ABSC36_04985, partial [Gaiellaceae bacterium]
MNSLLRAIRYTLQPTRALGDAWSWWQVILLLVPTAVVTIPTALASSVRNSLLVLAVVLLATLFCLALNAARRLADEVGVYEIAPRPFLAFKNTEVAEASEVLIASTGQRYRPVTPEGRPVVNQHARVFVANDPPSGRQGVLAWQVTAQITFERDGSPIISEMVGRWAEKKQHGETGHLGLTLESAQLDIEPNGLPHSLDIAMKGADDSN